jgi:integrase/recombinase XerD
MGAELQMRHSSGPLEVFKAGFAQHLSSRGYTPRHVVRLCRLIRDFDRWLTAEGLGLDGLGQSDIARFQTNRMSAGRNELVSSRALKPFTKYLRGIGIEPKAQSASTGATDHLLQRYRQYLEIERGLSNLTAKRYIGLVRPFLKTNLDGADSAELAESDVIAFVVAKCPTMDPGSAPLFVTALRSLLVFLHIDGVINRSMCAAVPTVPGRRLTGLPKSVTPAVLEQLFAACDRETHWGSRAYAVLKLLARLGLRASEVAHLQLDNINWRSGEIMIVRGKGNRSESLPLPGDVGAAVADYLHRWRPASATERAVLIGTRAPYGAMTGTGITNIVAGAARRCGLDPIYAHRLRHTAATQMLRNGASLLEVGQVLRHRQTITTAIYAKVDREALRTIAPAWPGDVS